MDGWVAGLVVFFVLWWLVLFTVLPWGVNRVENPEIGHADGAPETPRMALKFAVTTAITAVLWFAADWFLTQGFIQLR